MEETWSKGIYGKAIVLGNFQGNGEIYGKIVHDGWKPTLQVIIHRKV